MIRVTIAFFLTAVLALSAASKPESPKTTLLQYQQMNGSQRFAVLQDCVRYAKWYVQSHLINRSPADVSNHRAIRNFMTGNFDPDPAKPQDIPLAYKFVDSHLRKIAADRPTETVLDGGYDLMFDIFTEDAKKTDDKNAPITSFADEDQVNSFRYWTAMRYLTAQSHELTAKLDKQIAAKKADVSHTYDYNSIVISNGMHLLPNADATEFYPVTRDGKGETHQPVTGSDKEEAWRIHACILRNGCAACNQPVDPAK